MYRRPHESTLFPYTTLFRSRAELRRREFAVRAALGASRSRLLRQTMTEGVMLCVAGGMLGLWLADRKSTRLNSSHPSISYAVLCLKKTKSSPLLDFSLPSPL